MRKKPLRSAPRVAKIMADEVGHGQRWIDKELREFKRAAEKIYNELNQNI